MVEKLNKSLKEITDAAERIGVIGSPSSTSELTLDIMGSAVQKKLVGELAGFYYMQEGQPHYALGQIVEVRLRNVWHEDPTMRSLIRQRGRIETVSERQDTHTANMVVSAVFCEDGKTYRPSFMGTVPATGTPIHLVTNEVLQSVLAPYQAEIFYLGRVYGSKPLLPLWFKHFDSGPRGAGEAYHIGIFGKTGSGKSVLAKMILLAYARHPEMSILVIDPQGEFSKEVRGEGAPGSFQIPMREVLDKKLKKPWEVYSLRDLVLDRWELFAQILYESRFFDKLSVSRGENRQLAVDALTDELKKRKVKLTELHTQDAFTKAWEVLGDERVQRVFYRSEPSRERFKKTYEEADENELYTNFWRPIAQLFDERRQGAIKVESLLKRLLQIEEDTKEDIKEKKEKEDMKRPLVVIDLSREQAAQKGDLLNEGQTGNLFAQDYERIQALIIRRLLEGIRVAAERAYQQDKSLNTLVLMDEAHRLAPREEPEEEHYKAIRATLIDAVRTTRKYGLGWMFISQTLASLHREIIEQLRIFFFGFGLGVGTELRALSELVGSKSRALELYQLFRDPHSTFSGQSREYSFMTIGPVSPLSFSGTPLFFNAFNKEEDFLQENNLRS